MKKIYLAWIIPTSMIVGIVLFFAFMLQLMPDDSQSQYDWNSEYPDMSHYWICMDGCYYMEVIILGKLSIENKTHKKYHSDCSDVCWEQLIEQERN